MQIFKTRNDLLDTLPKGLVIAELGVFKGEFSEEILKRTNPSRLCLVDIWEGSMTSGNKDGYNIVQIDNMELVYNEIKEKYKDTTEVEVIRSSSVEYLNNCENDTFDMIYVDADHSYQGVTNDLKIAYHKLKDGGFLMGHDYVGSFYEVVTAVNDFCRNYEQKIIMLTEDGCPTFLIKLEKKSHIKSIT